MKFTRLIICVLKFFSVIVLYLSSLAIVISTTLSLFFPALRAIGSGSDYLVGSGVFNLLVCFILFSIAYVFGHFATKLLRNLLAKKTNVIY